MKVVRTGTGKTTPSTFKRYAGVAFLYGHLILLSKRIFEYKGKPIGHGGYWSPFAGHVEEGESPIACAVREVWEESGKKIKVTDLTYIKEIPREDGTFILYACELDSIFTPELNFEHTEYGYFKIKTLHTSPCPSCPDVVKAVRDFDAGRRKAGW